MGTNNKVFAEVIESSLDTYLAQTWVYDVFPKFGSLVQVTGDKQTILGCVTQVKTGSMDPVRYPFPYQKTEAELKAEQPQIFEFLKTTFTVTILGYTQTQQTQPTQPIQTTKKEPFYYTLPATPAKIHSFVEITSPELAIDFFSNTDFLHLLFASQSTISHFDDLLLAIFKQLAQEKKLTSKVLDEFCNKFSLLTGNDYRRMKLFLQRVQNYT